MLIWKTLMLLALIVWIGGIIFFAFVVAPTVFSVLTTVLAGNVVSLSLGALHWMGMVSAAVFLLSSLLYSHAKFARVKPFMLVNVLALAMLLGTLISQFGITPRIHALRAQLLDGSAVEPGVQAEFDRLHAWSTEMEGGVLILGLGVVVLTARRFS